MRSRGPVYSPRGRMSRPPFNCSSMCATYPAVRAVVSRGGRPDLAGKHLASVRAPTLLIVGGDDDVVAALNREAAAEMRCPTELVVIPGATHLFEEPGALELVADHAARWFVHLLPITR